MYIHTRIIQIFNKMLVKTLVLKYENATPEINLPLCAIAVGRQPKVSFFTNFTLSGILAVDVASLVALKIKSR